MADDDMLDTNFLFQPRGQGTGWCFRMVTPLPLIGQDNPRTGRPYGGEIREGLNTRDLKQARKLRDLRLGKIRLQEAQAVAASSGSMEQALQLASELKALDDDEDIDTYHHVIAIEADRIETREGTKKSSRWYKTAMGISTPLKDVCDQYKGDAGKAQSLSTLNNFNTALKEFLSFAGAEVSIEEVDRRMVAEFVTKHLPSKKDPKAPQGQGPATIRKKVSQLGQVWVWARKRGILPRERENPWDEQAPTAKEVKAAANVRRPFSPEETKKVLGATKAGDAMGDAIRVALLTGVRLEEVVGLSAEQMEPDARWYFIKQGKSDNAPRYVPLVDMAYDVMKARLEKTKGSGPLFPEVPIRKSTGKRGGAISQAFTRLRRDVLGEETDGELAEHCFRHTWRTAAARAGVDLRTAQEMGGWSRGRASDLTYDHGKELEHYREEQTKVARWLREKGYIG